MNTTPDEETAGPSGMSGQGGSGQPKLKARRSTRSKNKTNKAVQFGATCKNSGLPVRSQTTSKKHKALVNDPLGNKTTIFVPGIGKVTAKKLADKKYSKAYQLVGQYLVLNKTDQLFLAFIKECGAKGTYADQACASIKEWCEIHT